MNEEMISAKSKLPVRLLGATTGALGVVIAVICRIRADHLIFLLQRLHLPIVMVLALSELLTGLPVLLLAFGIAMAVRSSNRRQERAAAFYSALVLGIVIPLIIAIGVYLFAFNHMKP